MCIVHTGKCCWIYDFWGFEMFENTKADFLGGYINVKYSDKIF